MALTKPRAAQLYDIDYKQSARVVTTTNVNLLGGAPLVVDGVALRIGDRVLVTGQTASFQNGIYEVKFVGTGLSGSWERSQDAAISGQLLSGAMIVVSEGTTYKDTPWLLETNNPIILGTTALQFSTFSSDSFGSINANGTVLRPTRAGELLNIVAQDNINISGDPTNQTITISATYPIPADTVNYATGDASITGWEAVLGNWRVYFNPITVGMSTAVEMVLATNIGNYNITGGASWVTISSSSAISYNNQLISSTGVAIGGISFPSTNCGTMTLLFQDLSTSIVYRCTWVLGINFLGSSVLIEQIA
jgi:hypothetical protein